MGPGYHERVFGLCKLISSMVEITDVLSHSEDAKTWRDRARP